MGHSLRVRLILPGFPADPRSRSASIRVTRELAYLVRISLLVRPHRSDADTPAAEVFGSGDSCNTVAQQWLEKYRADEAPALTDLVNCILQCAGCDQEVTEDDIRDPENIPNRLIDLQSVYQEVKFEIASIS